jgi:hypothetical protein
MFAPMVVIVAMVGRAQPDMLQKSSVNPAS